MSKFELNPSMERKNNSLRMKLYNKYKDKEVKEDIDSNDEIKESLYDKLIARLDKTPDESTKKISKYQKSDEYEESLSINRLPKNKRKLKEYYEYDVASYAISRADELKRELNHCKDSRKTIINFLYIDGEPSNFQDVDNSAQDYYQLDNFIKKNIPNLDFYITITDDIDFGAEWNILAFTTDNECYGISGKNEKYFKFTIVDDIDEVEDVLTNYPQYARKYIAAVK